MPKLEIKGLGKLEKQLAKNVTMDDVKRVVRHNGAHLMVEMVKKADFKKGYQTGTTKRSITLEIKDGGFTAEVEPGTHYSPYVNYGTRYQEAQPFVTDSFNTQKEKFKRDLDKLTR